MVEKGARSKQKSPPVIRYKVLNGLGFLAQHQGDYAAAQKAHEECLAVVKAANLKQNLTAALCSVGSVTEQQGNFTTARKFYEEGLANAVSKYGMAGSYIGLAEVAYAEGNYATARSFLEKVLPISKQIGHKRWVSGSLMTLGKIAYYEGDYKSSLSNCTEVVAMARELGDKMLLFDCLSGFAALAIQSGKPNRAALLAGATEHLSESIGYEADTVERRFRDTYLDKIKTALPESEFNDLFEQGSKLNVEEAVALGLKETNVTADENRQTTEFLPLDLKDGEQESDFQDKLESTAEPNRQDPKTQIISTTTGDDLHATSGTEDVNGKIKRHKKSIIAAVAALLLTIGGIGLGYYFLNGNKSPFIFQAGQVTRLTSSGRIKAATISPDGKFVIYAQEENNQQQSLWMQHIGSESNVQIAPPANIEFRSLDISPDSNSLFYLDASGTLYRTAILGGSPKKVTDGLGNFFGNQISISPDSGQIAFIRRLEQVSPLFIANADGTNERRFTSFEKIRQLQRSAWSPDGKVIASVYYNSGHDNILAVQVADGASKPILPQDWNYLLNLTWLPDSKGLMTNGIKDDADQNFQIWQISYPDGEARQITNDTNNYDSVSLTSDGRILTAVRNEQIGYVWTMPAGSGDTTPVSQLTVGFEKRDGGNLLGWLPDGKIVYDSMPSGKSSVWAMETDGSNPRQLVKDIAPFALSPDGRYLVSQKGSGDNIGLWRSDLKDGSEIQLTKGTDVWATFSPDGKWVVFTRFADKVTLWKVPIEGGEPTQIVYKGLICPAVSPDGKMIAAVMGKIILISFNDGKVIKTLDIRPEKQERTAKQNLQWTPDGRGIYYIALNNGVSNIWRQPIDGSPPVQVTKFETGRIFNFAYSPDGKQLALSRGTLNSDVVLIKNSY